MILIVDGAEYDLHQVVGGAAIGDLRDLKKLTRGELGEGFEGVTQKTISQMFIWFGEQIKAGGDTSGFSEDDSFLLHMSAVFFLALRSKDPAATWADAGRVRVDQFSFRIEVEDEAPKAPPSDPVESIENPST